MKIDNDVMSMIISNYADANSVEKGVINNLIIMQGKLRNGVTIQSVKSIKDCITVDTVNYVLRKGGFKDKTGRYDDLVNASYFYQYSRYGDEENATANLLMALVMLTNKYLQPFCVKVVKEIMDYYNRYVEI